MIQDLIIIVILGIIVTLFYTIIDKNTNLQSGCPNWQGDGLQNRFVWVRVLMRQQYQGIRLKVEIFEEYGRVSDIYK